MTQSFSGIVPALKEEITMLKGRNTDLEKKVKVLETENAGLKNQVNSKPEKVDQAKIVASMTSTHG